MLVECSAGRCPTWSALGSPTSAPEVRSGAGARHRFRREPRAVLWDGPAGLDPGVEKKATRTVLDGIAFAFGAPSWPASLGGAFATQTDENRQGDGFSADKAFRKFTVNPHPQPFGRRSAGLIVRHGPLWATVKYVFQVQQLVTARIKPGRARLPSRPIFVKEHAGVSSGLQLADFLFRSAPRSRRGCCPGAAAISPTFGGQRVAFCGLGFRQR